MCCQCNCRCYWNDLVDRRPWWQRQYGYGQPYWQVPPMSQSGDSPYYSGNTNDIHFDSDLYQEFLKELQRLVRRDEQKCKSAEDRKED